jgi:hypothetical protein
VARLCGDGVLASLICGLDHRRRTTGSILVVSMNRNLHRQRLKWKVAKEKQWETRVAKSKRRSTSLVYWIPIFVIAACMVVESASRLRTGDTRMDYNYYFQPVGPVIRFAGGLFILCIGAIIVWRGRKAGSEGGRKDEQPPH